jgi:hypothetical protein
MIMGMAASWDPEIREGLINGLFALWRRCSRFSSSKYVCIFLRLKNVRA